MRTARRPGPVGGLNQHAACNAHTSSHRAPHAVPCLYPARSVTGGPARVRHLRKVQEVPATMPCSRAEPSLSSLGTTHSAFSDSFPSRSALSRSAPSHLALYSALSHSALYSALSRSGLSRSALSHLALSLVASPHLDLFRSCCATASLPAASSPSDGSASPNRPILSRSRTALSQSAHALHYPLDHPKGIPLPAYQPPHTAETAAPGTS